MVSEFIQKNYDFTGKTVVVTGGYGVLCSAICKACASLGANVVVLGRSIEKAQSLANEIIHEGGQAIGLYADVLDKISLEKAADQIVQLFGKTDILINGAGGNKPGGTTNETKTFFDLPLEGMQSVFDLNLMGTLLPSQIFGRLMASQKAGVILNISSMSAFRPLTRIPTYSAAKAAVNNFTQWLAVYMAQEFSNQIRVNAIAPGFFVTEQNRAMLLELDGNTLTQRGKTIIDHTPMGRFGLPEDLLGSVLWLISPASAFVTGVVIPVDGGFQAFGGV